MKMTTLEYFIAAAESGSFNAAARRSFVSQSSLTKALKSLENELGSQLFYRSSTGVHLTPEGEAILPEAYQMLEMYYRWRSPNLTEGLRKVFIWSHISLTGFLIPDIMLRFRERYPNLTINYVSDVQPQRRFPTGDNEVPTIILDLCGGATEVPHGFDHRVLTNGSYGCLVSLDSDLALLESVRFEDLMNYLLVLPNEIIAGLTSSSQPTTAIEFFLTNLMHVVPRKNIVEVGTVAEVIDMVRQHRRAYALSFSPLHYRYSAWQNGELAYLPIKEPGTDGQMTLFYPSELYRENPVFHELVESIAAETENFLRQSR